MIGNRDIRDPIRNFAGAMEFKLQQRDAVRGEGAAWRRLTLLSLVQKFQEEVSELREALRLARPWTDVREECVDVANMAMMIYDWTSSRDEMGRINVSDHETTTQQRPTGGRENVNALLIEELRERDRIGNERYGQSLHTFCGRSPVIDLKEELLDALQYAKQWELERATLIRLCRESLRFAQIGGAKVGHADWIAYLEELQEVLRAVDTETTSR